MRLKYQGFDALVRLHLKRQGQTVLIKKLACLTDPLLYSCIPFEPLPLAGTYLVRSPVEHGNMQHVTTMSLTIDIALYL